jgi:hypothetical protein
MPSTYNDNDGATGMRREFSVKPIDGGFSLKEHIYDVLKDGIMAMDIDADDLKPLGFLNRRSM